MKKANKLLALGLAGTMVLGCAACGPKDAGTGADQQNATGSSSEAQAGGSEQSGEDKTLVIAQDDFSEKFSQFFHTSVPDMNVAGMTAVSLLGNDRAGEIIYNGIEGETKNWNGTDYTYYGLSDLTVTENADGTVDYDFKIREDCYFSDGVQLTADDVIFSYYVFCDPSYDGASSTYALPIVGMDEYRSGSDTLFNLLAKAGADNTDFTYFTEDQQKKFYETDLPAAGAQFAQSIADYCVAKGYDAEVGNDIVTGMAFWGFGTVNEDGTFTSAATETTYTLQGDDVPTAEDFWNEIVAAYDGDIITATTKEAAESSILDFLPEEYRNSIETGTSAANIAGIQKVNDFEVKVTLSEVDATAVYQLGIPVQPMHYYGDESLYDYDNNKFGFEKGDLSTVRAKTTQPLGAGPYKFVKYENKTVYFEANENYYKGAPKTKNLQFKVTSQADKEPGVVQGTVDISDPSASKAVLEQVAGENSNKEISGDVLTTVLTDYKGYGYIGMNAENVCVNGDRGSEESKNLRKAIATVISVYRDVTIDSYYGDAAAVINYPISNTSWAAPQASDPDYKVAFSTDVDGNEIYTDSMSEDDKYAAALQAALGYFEAAGYTVTDGKLTAAPTGAKLSYEVMIGGSGKGDHPSFGILTAASEALGSIGFELKINDLSDSSILWSALESGTAEMWCAAWSTSIDPDMYQIYHSEGGSAGHYAIREPELDELVMEARKVTDQTIRKALYKEALDYVVDYAVEIPVYQRQDMTLFSSQRINVESITPDQTTYYTFWDEIQTIEMN